EGDIAGLETAGLNEPKPAHLHYSAPSETGEVEERDEDAAQSGRPRRERRAAKKAKRRGA
ncbi:MAG TPA: hypothetical protein PK929_18290, partial [Quisquiliibacterium sp.]|nr:hypothetical protein [Quisquiliibacterium sp.]